MLSWQVGTGREPRGQRPGPGRKRPRGSASPGWNRGATIAEPMEAFPTLGETLYDIGMVLAVILGVALTASAAFLS